MQTNRCWQSIAKQEYDELVAMARAL